MPAPVLVVDDDPDVIRLLKAMLTPQGLTTLAAANGAEARELLAREHLGAVVLDLMLPDTTGQEILAEIAKAHPQLPVVVLTAKDDVESVVECMQLGALDYVNKPFDRTRLLTSVSNALSRGRLRNQVDSLTQELRGDQGLGALVGASPALGKAVELLRRAASSDVTLLLTGESGTGKEVAARAVHAESQRRSSAFVPVNCGAIPEALVESELFGHERGAFTGANSAKPGLFERADGGTIFLDEIGELRVDLQVKLLRVLQDQSIQRVGGVKPRTVNVRVIAATNRNLQAEVGKGQFREDLYYRLAVFPVALPPLRQRTGDVLLLAKYFLERLAPRHGRSVSELSPEACRALERHSWPGNVRELENVLERAVILEDGSQLSLSSLPDSLIETAIEAGGLLPEAPPLEKATEGDIVPFEEEERRILLRALELTSWRIKEAAERLQIGRATLYRKIERYGLRASQG